MIGIFNRKPRNEKAHIWQCRVCKKDLREATKEEIDAHPLSWSHMYFMTVCENCAGKLDQKAYSALFHGKGIECTCHQLPEDKRMKARKIWESLRNGFIG